MITQSAADPKNPLIFPLSHAFLRTLISIRLCGRDQGQHILTKQRLVGLSGDPFAFRAMATRFLEATACFFGLGLAPNSLQAFLLRKQTSPAHPSSPANSVTAKTMLQGAATSLRLSAAIALQLLRETFCIWLYQHAVLWSRSWSRKEPGLLAGAGILKFRLRLQVKLT
jgi:hypothetical protein